MKNLTIILTTLLLLVCFPTTNTQAQNTTQKNTTASVKFADNNHLLAYNGNNNTNEAFITENDHANNASAAQPQVLVLESTFKCPKCSHQETMQMDTKSCRFFHECGGCKELVKAKKGQCCVFCSYGDSICPSQQTKTQKN